MSLFLTRMQAYEDSEDLGRNPTRNPFIGDIVAARLSRRSVIGGLLGAAAAAALDRGAVAVAQPAQMPSRFPFKELPAGSDPDHHVADGHEATILIRWGDPVLPGAPPFAPRGQTSAAQRMQFGFNNDFLGYLPMPAAADPSAHGLLVVNHEYTNPELMFPNEASGAGAPETRERAAIQMAAHGGAVLEVRRDAGRWSVVSGSRYARRIDTDTPMAITGPAAGHPRMRTSADPQGRRALGMLNNCAGGLTPWATWLTCEENIHGYFRGQLPQRHREIANFKRYGIGVGVYRFTDVDPRFSVVREPNESNRFGWVVEIDPFDPNSVPKKRTALGRMKHEGAAGAINKDGRYVVYMGDDERYEYVYRFVSRGTVDRQDLRANRDILDDGVLSVARFDADGVVTWLPLVHGQGPLTQANGFASQADVLIETRRAADLLGATRMDRPEDVEVDPATQAVYVVMTNNISRKPEEVDAANPRAANALGHIVEMLPPDGDHAAAQFRWTMLVTCGDSATGTFSAETSPDGWFGMPDNLAVDAQGRLWVATDGNSLARTGRGDGLWGLETRGPLRGTSRHFYRVPIGGELCGPAFTPDGTTLFLAVQHPGEGSSAGMPSTFDKPATRWPDFDPDMPPRPSVVVITRPDGGVVGGSAS